MSHVHSIHNLHVVACESVVGIQCINPGQSRQTEYLVTPKPLRSILSTAWDKLHFCSADTFHDIILKNVSVKEKNHI